jgi:DNA-binding response OmpR family regulator
MTKVLVADDDNGFSTAIARHLVASGYQVKTVSSVKDATHLLAEEHIDVVLTDLRMGDRDGIDLLAACKEARWPARAILMSAYATAKDYETAIKLGAVRVLCKPFTPQELVQAIREAVECETGFHGSLHGLSLVDILQMFHYGRRNATITIGGTLPGRIHAEAGQVVHADTDKDRGEKALIALLQARSGSVRTTVLSSEERTIKRSFDALLLDLLRVIDETAKSVPPPAETNDFDGWDFGSVSPTPLVAESSPSSVPPALPATVPPVPFRSVPRSSTNRCSRGFRRRRRRSTCLPIRSRRCEPSSSTRSRALSPSRTFHRAMRRSESSILRTRKRLRRLRGCSWSGWSGRSHRAASLRLGSSRSLFFSVAIDRTACSS